MVENLEVIFLTRVGCHLCDVARPVVEQEVRRRGGHVTEVDVDSDGALRAEFGHRVPVVLGPDEAVLAEGAIERRGLRNALRSA